MEINTLVVTDASVHDSQAIENLLDEKEEVENCMQTARILVNNKKKL